jgi:hypothetical protein
MRKECSSRARRRWYSQSGIGIIAVVQYHGRTAVILLLAALAVSCGRGDVGPANAGTQVPDASGPGDDGAAGDGPSGAAGAGDAGTEGADANGPRDAAGAGGGPADAAGGADGGPTDAAAAADGAGGPTVRCEGPAPAGVPCNGICKPELVFRNLATRLQSPSAYTYFAADRRRLFVRPHPANELYSVDLPAAGPPGPPTLLHAFEDIDIDESRELMALDTTHVYWLRTGPFNAPMRWASFHRKALGAPAPAQPMQLFRPEAPSHLGNPVLAGAKLVFNGQVATASNIYSGFFTLPVEGGTPTQLPHLKGRESVNTVVVGDRLFWIEPPFYQLFTAALSGGAVERLAESVLARTLIVDGPYLYWAVNVSDPFTSSYVGLIRRVPLDQPTAAQARDASIRRLDLGALQGSLAIDGPYAYLTTRVLDRHRLLRVAIDGSDLHEIVTTFAAEADFWIVVGTDCHHVYAVDMGGSVVRTRKPAAGPLASHGSPCTSHAQCGSHLCVARTCGGPATCGTEGFGDCKPKLVCGCDGVTYDSPCAAYGAGNLAFTEGRCP